MVLEAIPVEHLGTLTATVSTPHMRNEAGQFGFRAVATVTGASLIGPKINATMPESVAGGDWYTMRPDGTASLDIRLWLQTDDGADIYLTYTGYFVNGVPTKVTPRFETGDERYAWLNSAFVVGIGKPGGSGPSYELYIVDSTLPSSPSTVEVEPVAEPFESLPAEHLATMRATVDLDTVMSIQGGPNGNRNIFTVTSATLSGPNIEAAMPSGVAGADWSLGQGTGFGTLDVRLCLRTDDGADIYMTYTGISEAGKTFRTSARFETADKRYAWLNSAFTVGIGNRVPPDTVEHVFYLI
jgi:hypothetical protein